VILWLLVAGLSVFVVLKGWRETRRFDFVVAGALIGLTGGIGNAYMFRELGYMEAGIDRLIFSGIQYALITIAGLYLADKIGLPTFWPKEGVPPRWAAALIGIAIGLAVGAFNLWGIRFISEFPDHVYALQEVTNYKWLVTVMSVQAGLTEEALFRLFLFPGIALAVREIAPRPKWLALVAGGLGSGILFGLPAAHNLGMGVVVGGLFAAAYSYLGILPLIMGHIVADLLTFYLLPGYW